MQWADILAPRTARMRASEIRELLKLLDRPDIISFAGGIPDPTLFPAEAYREAMGAALAGENARSALQYSVSEGYLPLRQWLVGRMARLGVACDVDNIMITSGSQQALDYLAKLMIGEGDTVLVDRPTYLGALGAFNAYEPAYDHLDLEGNRNAEQYREAAERHGSRVKFAYLSPDFANPTGETVDRTGRDRLLDLAEELDIAVIEDAAYYELRYDGAALPAILALEMARRGDIDACRTIFCGSFSKTLAPGLRVGWVCAAREMIGRLVLVKQAADLHSPTLNQIVTAEVAAEGYDAHLETLRTVYGQRRDWMLAALAAEMPEGVTWSRPEGGMFIWLTLPEGRDAAALLARSLETEKVAFVPGHAFFADGSGANTLRLNFSLHDKPRIDDGIARLGRLLRSA